MATNKRMFSNDIVGSDAFLEMPPSTQALYFHLGMRADDDGFVNPRMVMRLVGSSDDELKVLTAKKFVLPFEDGVLVIKHWKINNNKIQGDRYKPTLHQDKLKTLYTKENGAYTLDCSQSVNSLLTQNRIEENRIEYNTPTFAKSDTPVLKAKKVRSASEQKEYNFDLKLKEWENGKPEEKVFVDFLNYKKIKFRSEAEEKRFRKTYFNSASIIKKYPVERTKKVFNYFNEKKGNDWSLWNVSSEISNQKYE